MKFPLLASLPLLSLGAFAQGPLAPSTAIDPKTGPIAPLTGGGVPQPTMKTLHQVEPRIPLTAGSPGVTVSGQQIVITASGSYYLTANFAVSSGAGGIVINTSGVTLDLNGFTISSTTTPAAGTAIYSGSAQVAVRNGNIFSAGTVSATGTYSGPGFATSVYLGGEQSHVSDLNVSGASSFGINMNLSATTLAESCTVNHCLQAIQANIITRCTARDIGYIGFRGYNTNGSTCRCNVGVAIYSDIVENCHGVTAGTTSSDMGIFAPGMVSHSYGGNGGGGSFSIYSNLAIGCSTSGTAQIVNKYNMP